MQAVIMAGGKGTRLRSVTGDELPKPMAPVCGKPLLQWQVEALRQNGVTNILLVTGYLGEKIETWFGDGSAFGVQISYFREEQVLGTAGALALLADRLEDTFFLVFGDVVFDIDLARMERFHREKQAEATLFVHPNAHPYDSDIVLKDSDARVCGFLHKDTHRDAWYHNCVNAGFYMLERTVCTRVPPGKKTDLEKELLLPMIREGRVVYAYASPEYIRDAGTPERLAAAQNDLQSGMVTCHNLRHPQRCIFLDRDGTINRYRGLISREEDFELEPCAAQAIRAINASGYLAAVVTNQPVVARGLCGIEDMERIHAKMESLLGNEGAYLDAITYCPHHPDKGYPEENPAYKIPCDCRKPATGMIRACAQAYHIDLTNSWMIGDTTMDLQTGQNAGMRTALVLTGEAGRDKKYRAEPDIVAKDLLQAVNMILEMEQKNGLPEYDPQVYPGRD